MDNIIPKEILMGVKRVMCQIQIKIIATTLMMLLWVAQTVKIVKVVFFAVVFYLAVSNLTQL